jgi:hypothetical protein
MRKNKIFSEGVSLLKGYIKDFNAAKGSVKFWNMLYFMCILIIGTLSFFNAYFFGILIFISLISIVITIVIRTDNNDFWTCMNIIVILFYFIVMIIGIFGLLWNLLFPLIIRFNNYLDKKV